MRCSSHASSVCQPWLAANSIIQWLRPPSKVLVEWLVESSCQALLRRSDRQRYERFAVECACRQFRAGEVWSAAFIQRIVRSRVQTSPPRLTIGSCLAKINRIQGPTVVFRAEEDERRSADNDHCKDTMGMTSLENEVVHNTRARAFRDDTRFSLTKQRKPIGPHGPYPETATVL